MAFAGGYSHNCALLDDKRVRGFDANQVGQLGVPGPGTKWQSMDRYGNGIAYTDLGAR